MQGTIEYAIVIQYVSSSAFHAIGSTFDANIFGLFERVL